MEVLAHAGDDLGPGRGRRALEEGVEALEIGVDAGVGLVHGLLPVCRSTAASTASRNGAHVRRKVSSVSRPDAVIA